jgi:16S rRNA (cytidine1402-2'-O)-methyltransferase
MPGTLFVVATPIGNLEDISARALRVLREAALIAAEDTRRTGHLLARYGITTSTTSLHAHNEAAKAPHVVARLLAGEAVALVSDAGTPTVSDPGRALIRAAIDAGIRIEPVPGPNAAIAALAASGFEADAFSFAGFPPTRSKDRKQWFERLRSTGGVVVFFEAPHRIQRTLKDLLAAVGDQPAMVARELTKMHEELVRGPISTLIEQTASPLGEYTVVVSIGHTIENDRDEHNRAQTEAADIVSEFGHMTNTSGLTRRQVISAIAKRRQLSSRVVYAAIEAGKKLG